MTTKTIYYPNSCAIEAVLEFCADLDSSNNVDDLIVDFSNMGRVEPFAMLFIARRLRTFEVDNRHVNVSYRNYETQSYVGHMGFFKSFGLDFGKKPGEACGNNTYLPLTILRTQIIRDEANKEWKSEQDIIERRAEELAVILSQQKDGNLVDVFTYSIREIVRNVVEHSGSKQVAYCAQYWPAYKKVEIAILDAGVGLKESISQNPFVEVTCDSDAIQQVLMPAISSKNYKGAIIDTDDPWHNSGFGLYMTNRLCRNGGEFFICSGAHGILLNDGGKQHIDLGFHYEGTVVKLVLNTSKLDELKTMLSQFQKDGFEAAKQIKGVGVYNASAASQMLSRDFKTTA
ncbi:hypothetical protein [Vibrio crassostreae]|uniref:hypothetical protein n=1 Tax=Vibrio crassostreae TaxID=246167 RepID=UPI001B312C86|nr:hypothetical protein [Vibrio crassostreae]